jgi:high-affinity K+ transport system ATPase subunit B
LWASERESEGPKQPTLRGIGGIIAPFVGIKAIDLVLNALHLA